MSAYPECKHGHNHPMHRCEQCDLENELDRLREENRRLKEQSAAIAAAREALEWTLQQAEEWYGALTGSGMEGEYREQLQKAHKALALLNGQQP